MYLFRKITINREKYNEDDLTNPLSIYGKSKLAGEKNIVNTGCKHFIFRTSWVCGENGKNFIKTTNYNMFIFINCNGIYC